MGWCIAQMTEALAYALYMTISTFLPNVTTAVVLFYGGNLVLDGSMSAGSLVSFMLYQQSLSSAFQVCLRPQLQISGPCCILFNLALPLPIQSVFSCDDAPPPLKKCQCHMNIPAQMYTARLGGD